MGVIQKSYSLEERFICVRKKFREPLTGVPGRRVVKRWSSGVVESARRGGRGAPAAGLRALPEHARVYKLATDQEATFRRYYSHYTCGNKIKKATKPAT